MKNLLISPIGDYSLHNIWLRDATNFDSYLIYYGNEVKITKSTHFIKMKGTKFNILKELYEKNPEFFKQYDYIFVPDDDLHITTQDVNRIFKLANEYKLEICQPSIIGYYDVSLTLHVPEFLLRYTNFVEVMCPCFSQNAFQKCLHTFDYTKSCWGIDVWWDKILGCPKDKQAILDDVIAIHTRRCRGGENYTNNDLRDPYKDLDKLFKEYDLDGYKKTYKTIAKDIGPYGKNYKEPDECYYPHVDSTITMCNSLRQRKWMI